MSTVEIKLSIDQMTPDERFFAAAYLHHLAQVDDPAYLDVLNRRLARMDTGRKITSDQLQRVHESLEREGV